MVGLMDGVRLFNDLHMKPVAPRLTIYIAQVKFIYRTSFIFVVKFLLKDCTTIYFAWHLQFYEIILSNPMQL